jgi:hypothetical protein
MTRDEDAPDPILFDRRIVERNIRRGLITRKDYDKFLKSLSDASGKLRSPDEVVDANPGPAETNTPPHPAS